MKFTISVALLLATSLSANAQTFAFSGENSLSIEGGIASALNFSQSPLVVVNNIGADAPWAVTELVSASLLDFGTGASFGAEANFGLTSGKSIYLRSSGNFASGGLDLAGLFAVDGAIPGIFDDDYLLPSAWNPIVTVNTRILDTGIGIKTDIAGGGSFFAGLLYGEVAQDFQLTYDPTSPAPAGIRVSGRSNNAMLGVEIGGSYTRALSDKLKLVVFGEVAALSNSFDYRYQYLNPTSFSEINQSQSGSSISVRSEIAAQLVFARSEKLAFTGKIGVLNYTNVATGLENTINPGNTNAIITPVFNAVTVPYIRAGIRISF